MPPSAPNFPCPQRKCNSLYLLYRSNWLINLKSVIKCPLCTCCVINRSVIIMILCILLRSYANIYSCMYTPFHPMQQMQMLLLRWHLMGPSALSILFFFKYVPHPLFFSRRSLYCNFAICIVKADDSTIRSFSPILNNVT